MQVGPPDDIRAGTSREAVQTQPPEHSAEADLDTHQLDAVAARAGQHDVGHPGDALTDDVDDLRVQHIALQQDLVRFQCGVDRTDGESGIGLQHHPAALKASHRFPGHEQIGRVAPAHQQSRDQERAGLLAEVHRQVADTSDGRATGRAHLLAGDPAEQLHVSSMPETLPGVSALCGSSTAAT